MLSKKGISRNYSFAAPDLGYIGHVNKSMILHVTDAYAAGVMTAINELALMQSNQGHLVTVLVLERKETVYDAEEIDPKIKIINIGKLSLFGLFRMLLYIIKNANNFSFIHLHSSRAGFLGRLVLIFKRIPVVLYTPHGFSFIRRDINHFEKQVFISLEKFMAKISNATILAVSIEEAKLATKIGNENVQLLHNAISIPSEFCNYERYSNQIRKWKIAFVGRNTPAKDPFFFLHLAREMKNHAEFIWIGASSDEFMPDEIPANLSMLGFLPRKKALEALSEANAMIVTSIWEGLPTNIIEAQMLGILVFQRDTLEIPELIENERTGIVFKNANDLDLILGDSDLYIKAKRISLQARDQAFQNFSSFSEDAGWLKAYQNSKFLAMK